MARGRCSSGSCAPSLHDFLVRAPQRQVQEAQRIEQRLRGVPEGLDDHLLGYLGGAGAIGVTAHAVDDDEQGGVLGNGRAHPVLVLFAPTQQADFGTFDSQRTNPMHLIDLADTLYHLCGGRA